MTASITNLKKKGLLLASIGAAIAGWGAVSLAYPPILFPSPAETFLAMRELVLDGSLFREMAITSGRAAVAFALSFVAGMALGAVAGSREWTYRFCKPLITTMQTIPPISWIVMAMIWFRFSGAASVFVVVVATFPVFAIHAIEGVRRYPEQLVQMARLFRVGWWRIMKDIYAPAMWPYASSAISVCIGMTWKTIVMAELLSSQSGLGAALSASRLHVETPEVFAWTAVVVILGVTTEQLFQWLSDRTRVGRLRKWISAA